MRARLLVPFVAAGVAAAFLLAGWGMATPRLADTRPGSVPVDTELVIAVDVSNSMDPEEQALQREGYILGLTSREFLGAIAQGGHGNVAAIRVALMAVLARHGYGDREDGVNYYPTPEAYTRRLVRHGFHVEQIALIPRPTPLTETGMTGWLKTFRRGVLDGLPEALRETIVEETAALLAPALCDEGGNWTGDYIRLRFIATA